MNKSSYYDNFVQAYLPPFTASWEGVVTHGSNWIVGKFLETLDIWHQFEPTCFLVIQSMYTVNVIPAYQLLPHGDRLDSLFNFKIICISFSSMFQNVYNSYSVFVKAYYSFIFKFVLIVFVDKFFSFVCISFEFCFHLQSILKDKLI